MPSTAVAAAWAELAEDHQPVLDVLLHLPVRVIDTLDESRARAVGQLRGHQGDAHAIVCAKERGWPLLTVSRRSRPPELDSGAVFRCHDRSGVEFGKLRTAGQRVFRKDHIRSLLPASKAGITISPAG